MLATSMYLTNILLVHVCVIQLLNQIRFNTHTNLNPVCMWICFTNGLSFSVSWILISQMAATHTICSTSYTLHLTNALKFLKNKSLENYHSITYSRHKHRLHTQFWKLSFVLLFLEVVPPPKNLYALYEN